MSDFPGFELGEVPEEELPDEFVDVTDHDVKVALETIHKIDDLLRTLEITQAIDRTTASTLRTFCTGLESIQNHFNTYPLCSYTRAPSSTNLKATQESLGLAALAALRNFIKAVLKFLSDVIKGILAYRRSNRRAVAMAARVANNVEVLSELNAKTEDILRDTLSPTISPKFVEKMQSIESSVLRTTKIKWNALLDKVANGYQDPTTDPLWLFRCIVTSINVDAEKVEQYLKHLLQHLGDENPDYLVSNDPMAVNKNEPLLEIATKLGAWPTELGNGDWTDYQKLAYSLQNRLKGFQMTMAGGSIDLSSLRTSLTTVRSLLSDSYLREFESNTSALSSVDKRMDEVMVKLRKQVEVLDPTEDNAARDLNQVMSLMRSYTLGLQNMDNTARLIFSQVGYLTNIFAEYERLRRKAMDEFITGPGLETSDRQRLVKLRDQYRKKLH